MAASGTPGIEERRGADGDVHFRVRVRRRGREASGTFASHADALAFRTAALAAMNTGRTLPFAPDHGLRSARASAIGETVLDAAQTLCRRMKDGAVRARNGAPFKPSVVRKYEAMLRLHVVPRIGALPVDRLNKRDVQRLVDELALAESAETARKALTALRVAIRVAEEDGLLDGNPCAGVRVPFDPVGERIARILTPEESWAILAAAEADDIRRERSLAGPLVRLAFGTGLRSGELLALAWGPEGLDLEAGVVRVRRSLDRDPGPDGRLAFIQTKSRAGRREVPLTPGDLAALKKHRLATGRPHDGALVFAHERGRPLSAKGIVRYAWSRAVRDAKIAPPLPKLHDARHAYATAMLAAGISPHALARLMGHADAGLIYRRYGHALPDELAGAGLTLEAFRRLRGVVDP
jgi:integrase